MYSLIIRTRNYFGTFENLVTQFWDFRHLQTRPTDFNNQSSNVLAWVVSQVTMYTCMHYVFIKLGKDKVLLTSRGVDELYIQQEAHQV